MILDNMEYFVTPYGSGDFMHNKRVVVLAPHCDDEVFGCGGVITKALRDGCSVKCVVVCRSFNHKIRESESKEAASLMGYEDIEFLEFVDGELYEEREKLVQYITTLLNEYRADTIFIPSFWEMHRDHLACAMACVESLYGYEESIDVVMYEVGAMLYATDIVDVSDVYEIKKRAMECFGSQEEMQNYKEQIEGLNIFRTYTLSRDVKYAEAFWVGDKESAIELYESKNIDKFYHSLKCASNEVESAYKARGLIETECDELFRVKNHFESEFTKVESENVYLQMELDRMKYSLSWRITKPLRGFNAFLRAKDKKAYIKMLLPGRAKVYLRSLLHRVNSWCHTSINSSMNQKSNMKLLLNRFKYLRDLPKTFDVLELRDTKIDITLVTYNSSKWLRNYMDSLLGQDYDVKNINLFVVDNGSSDDSLEILDSLKREFGDRFYRFEIISSQNDGFGTAHNRAVKYGDAPYILVSNPDIEFNKSSLSNIVKVAINDSSDVGSWELRQIPYEHPKHYDPVSLECSWSSHACILIRREAFESIGGYDERMFLYGEDVEFSYRLRANGWRLRYVPVASVNHYTYAFENEIKPSQYVGGTIANLYLRLRYGSIYDGLSVIPLSLISFFLEPFEGASSRFRADFRTKLIPYISDLLRENRADRERGIYPFRSLDYEEHRDGAFYEITLPKEEPLVSIITRTMRGRENLLIQAAYSVFNQTYKNIEWIVIEDGGTTSCELVKSFEILTSKKILYKGCEKIGRSAAGNEGLRISSGKYVMFLDDDDLLYADHIEILVSNLLENSECVAAYSLAFMVESKVTDGGLLENNYIKVAGHNREFDYKLLREMNYIPIQSILFERRVFEERGGFDTTIDHLEDWNLWQRYAHNNKFIFVPKGTSLYRVPMDLSIRARRQKELDEAYDGVKRKTALEIESL